MDWYHAKVYLLDLIAAGDDGRSTHSEVIARLTSGDQEEAITIAAWLEARGTDTPVGDYDRELELARLDWLTRELSEFCDSRPALVPEDGHTVPDPDTGSR